MLFDQVSHIKFFGVTFRKILEEQRVLALIILVLHVSLLFFYFHDALPLFQAKTPLICLFFQLGCQISAGCFPSSFVSSFPFSLFFLLLFCFCSKAFLLGHGGSTSKLVPHTPRAFHEVLILHLFQPASWKGLSFLVEQTLLSLLLFDIFLRHLLFLDLLNSHHLNRVIAELRLFLWDRGDWILWSRPIISVYVCWVGFFVAENRMFVLVLLKLS